MNYKIEMPARFYTHEVHDFLHQFYDRTHLDLFPFPEKTDYATMRDQFTYEMDFEGEKITMMEISFYEFERAHKPVNDKFLNEWNIPAALHEGDWEGTPAYTNYVFPNGHKRFVEKNTDDQSVVRASDIEKIVKDGGTMRDIVALLEKETEYNMRPIEWYALHDHDFEEDRMNEEIAKVLEKLDDNELSQGEAMILIREIKEHGSLGAINQ